ncbi:hypothetical protein PIB30_007696 [Stylosanthes scabra]|uniref:Uncharacterized protein n=1 Tax=Stylosanthes scabra TaxID=79078 RepID=A0ABU6X3Q4_9FABA|nr:hypothetical protein [Stylosanthes scabra]
MLLSFKRETLCTTRNTEIISSPLPPPHQRTFHCRVVDAAAVRGELPGVSTCCRLKKSEREPFVLASPPPPLAVAGTPLDRSFVLHHLFHSRRRSPSPSVALSAPPDRRCSPPVLAQQQSHFDVPNPARPVPETEPLETLVNPLADDDVVLVQLSNRLHEEEQNEEPDGDTEEEELLEDDISSSEPEEEPILPDSD